MRRVPSALGSLAALAALAAAAPAARAQEEAFSLPLERFRPTIDDRGLATTEGGGIPTHLGFQAGLVLNYALNPLVLRDADDNIVAPIVAHRVGGNALFTFGLFDVASIGLDLPLALAQVGGTLPDNLVGVLGAQNGLAGLGIGDLRVVPKIRLLREDRHFVSLAFLPTVSVPTASGLNFRPDGVALEYGTSYLGEGPGAFAFIPELAASTNVAGVRVAANLAYRIRQPVRFLGALDVNSELVYRAGVGYDLATLAPKMRSLLLFGEVFGATPDKNPFGLFGDAGLEGPARALAEAERRLTNPLEWGAGVRYRLTESIALEGGFGSGLLPGYGSPDLRFFAGLRFVAEDNDKDDDGILDADDACPNDPEDKDGYEDADGCPDPDNDGDGIPDDSDRCPNDAEDKDGFEDEDGCPDPDNDGDGILDADDRCPDQRGEAAFAGCPAPDRDGDGTPDAADLCPDVAGKLELAGCPDRDNDGIDDEKDYCPDEAGPQVTGGCPDQDGDAIADKDDRCPEQPGTAEHRGCPDTDKDGIADPDDKCPNEPETINGFEDEDGCPDKGKVLVEVTREKINLKETVYFDTGKDTIQKRSFSLLDQVALVMKAHPEVKKVLVEGHTDDRGDDAFNLDLSKRRAASVARYLIDHGVSADRLASEGYGETKPIAPNLTNKGREQNRRVELRIVEE
jgi:large repetitive protein